MRLDNFFKDKVFALSLASFAISSITRISMHALSRSEEKCQPVIDYRFCAIIHLCEKVNNYVCEEKPYLQTAIETGVEAIFLFSLGVTISYSLSYLVDKYITRPHNIHRTLN